MSRIAYPAHKISAILIFQYIAHLNMTFHRGVRRGKSIEGIRKRVAAGRSAVILGTAPKHMASQVHQTREIMRQLTALVVKVHGETSIHHLQLISEWAEAEVSRRLLWREFRMHYPGQLTIEQLCMIRKDTQRYAAEKSRCIKELQLDSKRDAFQMALEDDEPELIDPKAPNTTPEGYENVTSAFQTTCKEAGVEHYDVVNRNRNGGWQRRQEKTDIDVSADNGDSSQPEENQHNHRENERTTDDENSGLTSSAVAESASPSQIIDVTP